MRVSALAELPALELILSHTQCGTLIHFLHWLITAVFQRMGGSITPPDAAQCLLAAAAAVHPFTACCRVSPSTASLRREPSGFIDACYACASAELSLQCGPSTLVS